MIRIKNRKGVSLLEMTLVLALFGILLGSVSKGISDMNEMQNARSIAVRQTQIINAARAYMNANMNDLVANTQGGNIITVQTGRKSPNDAAPAGSLQDLGFLPGGFVDVNTYGQNSVLIFREGEVEGTVQAIVANYGGRPANDSVLGMATRFIGPMGGMVQENGPAANTDQINGFAGGWRINKSDFETGTFNFPSGYNVSYIESSNGETMGNFLWRTDIGNPEANRMHTNIDMNGNDLNRVKSISASEEVLHVLAKMDTELLVAPANSTPGAATSEDVYKDPSGNRYENYIRPDGYNRLAYLDPNTDISHSDTPNSSLGKNYPAGTRLVDALPNLVVMASYYAEDYTIVPKPVCGNGNLDASVHQDLAKIYAMPISSFDIIGPGATTSGNINYIQVPVVTDVRLTGAANTGYNMQITKETVNSVDAASPLIINTKVDAMAIAYGIYADDIPGQNAWLFRYRKKNWVYENSSDGSQGSVTEAPIDSKNGETYKNMAMIQTACYYGN